MFDVVVIVLGLFWAFFGACLGSFAGVIIYRFQEGISIVYPGSFCAHCKTPLKIWHVIPIVSWLILWGRCSYCKQPIGTRLLVLELLSALATLALWSHFGLSYAFFERVGLYFLLVCLSYIDLDSFFLPTSLLIALFVLAVCSIVVYSTYPALYVGIAQETSLLRFMVLPSHAFFSLSDRVQGGLFGLLSLTGINIFATGILRFFKRLQKGQWAMGFGDAFLFMTLGLFVGLSHSFLVLFLASFLGSLIGVIMKFNPSVRHDDIPSGAIPFGPFLALAALYVYCS